MFNFWTFMYLLFVGIVAGFLARLFVPGEDNFTWWQTILIGVIGSFVGGFLGYVLFGFDDDEGAIQPGGIFGSIIGAVIVLLVWRAIRKRSGARSAMLVSCPAPPRHPPPRFPASQAWCQIPDPYVQG